MALTVGTDFNTYPSSSDVLCGTRNIAIGNGALLKNGVAFENTAMGFNAVAVSASSTKFSIGNVALGAYAMYDAIQSRESVAIGSHSQCSYPTINSVAVGADAMYSASGYECVAIGYGSLYASTGEGNISIGLSNSTTLTSGTRNTVIGYHSEIPTTSRYNTIIGNYYTATPISNNIIVADGAGAIRIRTTSDGVTLLYHGANVASASTITATGNSFHDTGTTGITSISGSVLTAGPTITLIFDGSLTVTDGSNLKLAGNLSATAGTTLTLKYDGTNFY